MGCEAQNHLFKSEYGQAQRIHIHHLQNPYTEENPHMYASTLLNIAEVDVMIGANEHDVLQSLNKAKAVYKAHEIWTMIYLAHASTTQANLDLCKALQFRGYVFLHNGDAETVHILFIVALEAFTYMVVHHRANCMVWLGDLAQQQGHLDEAVEHWQTARPLFELSLQTKDVTQIDARLGAVDQANQKALDQLTTLNVATDSFETLLAVEETDTEEEGKLIQEDIMKDVSLMAV
ncbi:hypothetical protein FB451DRAFT_1164389 [Mycena latifolia]|nr:hypothetical protein FB451DRAFT_1164389 [Mycena latifolia]